MRTLPQGHVTFKFPCHGDSRNRSAKQRFDLASEFVLGLRQKASANRLGVAIRALVRRFQQGLSAYRAPLGLCPYTRQRCMVWHGLRRRIVALRPKERAYGRWFWVHWWSRYREECSGVCLEVFGCIVVGPLRLILRWSLVFRFASRFRLFTAESRKLEHVCPPSPNKKED